MRFLFALALPVATLAVIAAACDDVTVYDIPIVDEAGIEGGLGVLDDGSGGAIDRFCVHTDAGLCADFDGPDVGEWADAGAQTSPANPPKGADLEVGDGPTGKDLVVTLPAGSDAADVSKGFVHAGTEPFRAEADVNIPRPPASWLDNPVGIFSIVYGASGFSATARVAGADATDGKISLVVQGTTVTTGGDVIVPFDTWFHVVLTVNPSAGTAALTTSLGASLTASSLAAPAPAPAALTLEIGLQREAPSVTPTALILQADNVVGFVGL